MNHINKQIYLGAAYYPEMWDEAEIDNDIKRCKAVGINTLRIGEFAWGKMEPREGEFDFTWLLRLVDKLYEADIYTVMCTPSATPPRWLLNKYEETRMVMHDLIRADVSSRCHTCKTSPKMREKNRIIVKKAVKILGKHKGVIGWQIDNEIFPYTSGCFCPLCKKEFRSYLKEKYGTVEKLNIAWGMSRWSLSYDSFEDVQPPYPKQWKHPSLNTEWHKFQCEQIYAYVNEQAEILHTYTNVPVGTDMMQHNLLSYYKTNEKLDVIQYNHYEASSSLAHTAFGYDFIRPIKNKPFWVMETQVGWNGSEYAENGYRPDGNSYINTWLPIAKGGEMNLYWLFRTHPNGHEIAHGALFSTAGRAYRVSDETKKAVDDFEKCKDFLLNTKVKSKIALHYSHTSAVNFKSAAILKDFDYRKTVLNKFYMAFRHHNIDVIDTPHSLDGYKVVISPFLTTVCENGLKESITQWVHNGGTWIVGPMSDIMDENTSKYTAAPFSFLEETAGVYTKYQKPLDNNVFKAKWVNDGDCAVSMCYDAYETKDGTTSLAKYTEGEFSPLSVITERKLGKGKVVLLGSVISHSDLLRLTNMASIANASDNVIIVERSGLQNGIIALETENKAGYIVLDGEYIDQLTGKAVTGKIEVLPYNVHVFKKN